MAWHACSRAINTRSDGSIKTASLSAPWSAPDHGSSFQKEDFHMKRVEWAEARYATPAQRW